MALTIDASKLIIMLTVKKWMPDSDNFNLWSMVLAHDIKKNIKAAAVKNFKKWSYSAKAACAHFDQFEFWLLSF